MNHRVQTILGQGILEQDHHLFLLLQGVVQRSGIGFEPGEIVGEGLQIDALAMAQQLGEQPDDLGHGALGDFVAQTEFKVSAPAVNTTMVTDTRTMTYSIIHSDNSDLSSPSVLISSIITQTGAGGAGAAAASATFRVPLDMKRYLGVRIVSGISTTDSSAVSATLEGLF